MLDQSALVTVVIHTMKLNTQSVIDKSVYHFAIMNMNAF